MNFYPVTVVDNFLNNPDEVRAFALRQQYRFCHEIKDIDYVFPGSRTTDLFDLDKKLYAEICKKFVSIFHNTEHDVMRWAVTTSFQIVTAEYGQGVIHSDHNTIMAAVLYLTPDAPLEAGTSLFKKNKTFDEAQYQQALEDNDARFKKGEIMMDTAYHSMFDEIVRVNNVYNSLIIYEGDIHHCANQFFGDTPENGRLAQVFFISKIDAKKHDIFPLHRKKLINV